jgi:hypothetical protein
LSAVLDLVKPAAVLAGLADSAAQRADRARVLPVHDELAGLLPWGGLRRGSTVAVRGSTALLLALLAEATTAGSWAGVVGMPNLGVLAASELGVAVDRLALVPRPGNQAAAAAAALIDGLDLVVVSAKELSDAHARRLSARARHRGSVLLPFGSWPGADLELACEQSTWEGLKDGHGFLRHRTVTVHTRGRGAAARPLQATLLLPGPNGTIAATPNQVEPLARPRWRTRAG